MALVLLACGCREDSVDPTSRGRGREAGSSSGAAAAESMVTGRAAPATGGFPSVVILEPRVRDVTPAPTETTFMDQMGSAFYPPVLLVRAGQTVEFSNSEEVMHNVHVAEEATQRTEFNVATPPGMETYEHVFDEAGVYRVGCDIHPHMAAFIVVVETPWAVVAGKDGSFTFSGVPPGTYELKVWNLDGERRLEKLVEVSAGETHLGPVGQSAAASPVVFWAG